MEKLAVIAGILLTLSCLSSCSGVLSPGQEASLTIVISDGMVSKVSDGAGPAYETKINDLQFFLFDGAALCRQEKVDTRQESFPFTRTYSGIRAGDYTLHVVANAADLGGVTTESSLGDTAVSLSDCSLDETEGFVMAGSVSVSVPTGGGAVQAAVTLQRLVSRVRLVSIENQLPETYAQSGAVTVKGVFLINALGSWNLAGRGPAGGWVNLGGRVEGRASSTQQRDYLLEGSQVHPAAFRPQVFRSVSATLARGERKEWSDCSFYTFPNPVTEDRTGASATETEGALTRLVVLAQVDGADWWYPVTLFRNGMGPRRNTTSDVKLTLRATGSGDPNEPVGPGKLEAAVTVCEWLPGVDYTETI